MLVLIGGRFYVFFSRVGEAVMLQGFRFGDRGLRGEVFVGSGVWSFYFLICVL